MLSCKLGGIKTELSFSFFAVAALAACSDAVGVFVSLLCCILHELGHISAMLYFGQRPDAVCFYGGGIKIKASQMKLSVWQEAAVLSAGCVVNAVLYFLCCVFGLRETLFASANLLLFVFNLLPFKSLDGGRLLALIGDSTLKFRRLIFAMKATAGLFVVIVFFRAVTSGYVSFTVIIAAIYMSISNALC